MNRSEAAKLLTVASGFDRRQVDELTATAWASALDGYSYGQVEAAIIGHFTDVETRRDYLTIGHVLDRLERTDRTRRHEIADDVRSAKARGIIDRSWPNSNRLPADVLSHLRELREAERSELKALGGAE